MKEPGNALQKILFPCRFLAKVAGGARAAAAVGISNKRCVIRLGLSSSLVMRTSIPAYSPVAASSFVNNLFACEARRLPPSHECLSHWQTMVVILVAFLQSKQTQSMSVCFLVLLRLATPLTTSRGDGGCPLPPASPLPLNLLQQQYG